MESSFSRWLFAEILGAAILLAIVVRSGITAVIIMVLGPVFGAHFNPTLTFAFALRGEITLRQSGSDRRPGIFRYVCRHPPDGCAALCHRAICRSSNRLGVLHLAVSVAAAKRLKLRLALVRLWFA